MVSYLLIIFVLSLVVSGIFFSFSSDTVDTFVSAINGYTNTPLAGSQDQDSINTGYLLMWVFKIGSLLLSLICLIYWLFVMSQKPEKSF